MKAVLCHKSMGFRVCYFQTSHDKHKPGLGHKLLHRLQPRPLQHPSRLALLSLSWAVVQRGSVWQKGKITMHGQRTNIGMYRVVCLFC